MKQLHKLLILGSCLLLLCWACGGDEETATDQLPIDSVTVDSLSLADSLQASMQLRKDSADSLMAGSLNIDRFFKKHGVEGAFLLFDPQKDRYYHYNKPRTQEPMLPASTFKIFNALVALETGVIAHDSVSIPWDGKDRGVDMWNREHTLASGMKYSVVWFYQELARRIGPKRMQHYLNACDYGNARMGAEVDKFWLEGGLRITMEEQLKFLRQLYREELPPFSTRSMNIVKRIIVYLEGDNYVMTGKTGWGQAPDPDIGWFVGYLIKDDNTGYYFATNIDIKRPEDAKAREAITLEILKEMGIL